MLVWCGLIIHVIQLASIFDIYFTSPLITQKRDVRLENDVYKHYQTQTPAKRLVLFIADGLRADSFIKSEDVSYLKTIALNRGSWGISNTRIPTESRPGHVAIIAGFYEDPSAVTKGWKENPVEFDSVFNQSRYTWSWGSPDILPMFAKGASGDHIFTNCYSHEMEDFSGKESTSKLDTWVFENVEIFFKKAENDTDFKSKLYEDKIIFFLHLLGLDTAGHTHKPHSTQYKHNMKIVNDGIAKIEALVENFYDHDNKTAYIFTADHGMTDWGSHGAGSDHETKTPFIAWGSGIKKYKFKGTFENIFLNNKSLNQADICPFMACLINVNIPVDSVGTIPDEYFDSSEKDKAIFLYKNMKQILNIYNNKRIQLEMNALKMLHKPFYELSEKKIQHHLSNIELLFQQNHYDHVKFKCLDVIKTALLGLEYYQNYYQHSLLTAMTLSYFGWIIWLLTILLQKTDFKHDMKKDIFKESVNGYNFVLHFIFGILSFFAAFLIFVQNFPLQYYIYFLLPILLWWKVFSMWTFWYKFFINLNEIFKQSYIKSYLRLVIIVVIYIAGTILLVSSFFHRWTLSIGLVILALFPFYEGYHYKLNISILFGWIFTCLSLAVFSFLPVIGNQDDIHFVGMSGILWFIYVLTYLFFYSSVFDRNKENKIEKNMMMIPAVMIILAIINKYFVAYYFSMEKGLPMICQFSSWTLGVLSCVVPLFSSRWIFPRLFCIKSSLAVLFILLSVTHEGFFLITLAINLSCWIIIEYNISGPQKGMKLTSFSFDEKSNLSKKILNVERPLNWNDFRISFIFLLYIILSFFGTGNIASINSFDPQWVRCFVAQFSPFTMGALILLKTLIPFLFVTSTFCALNIVIKAPTGKLFLLVLVFSDLMGLQFLHMVTNKGSWLDIGTSISHYVIMQATVFFTSILYGVGYLLTSTSGWDILNTHKRIKNS